MANNYVDTKKLLADMLEYEKERNASDKPEDVRASDYVYHCIVAISNEHHKSANFYTQNVDINDLISQSMVHCLKGLLNFNSEVTRNPFGYFSQIAYYAYLSVLIKEQRNFKNFCKIIQNNAFGVIDTIADVTGSGEPNSEQVSETISKIQVYLTQDTSPDKPKEKKNTRMPLYLKAKKEKEALEEESDKPESITDRITRKRKSS